MSSSSRKKGKISPETLAPPLEEDNICSEDDMSALNPASPKMKRILPVERDLAKVSFFGLKMV
jgi:hypothetical protein